MSRLVDLITAVVIKGFHIPVHSFQNRETPQVSFDTRSELKNLLSRTFGMNAADITDATSLRACDPSTLCMAIEETFGLQDMGFHGGEMNNFAECIEMIEAHL